jgi:hypothetical protein
VGRERGEEEAEKGIVPKEAVRRRNPLVPWHIIRAVWSSLKTLRAGDKWPAVLARAAPMTPAQGADEDGARAPPRPKGTPPFKAGRRSALCQRSRPPSPLVGPTWIFITADDHACLYNVSPPPHVVEIRPGDLDEEFVVCIYARYVAAVFDVDGHRGPYGAAAEHLPGGSHLYARR